MPGIFDTHCHLMDELYKEDVDKLVKEAVMSHVSKMACVGYDLVTSKLATNIALQFNNVYAAIGIHPTEVGIHTTKDLEELKAIAHSSKVIAIGEIGLDYFHKTTEPALQKKWFIAQLRIAKALNLPVLIHCRDAYEDVYKILKAENMKKGIMHCFLGTIEQAKRFIKLGFMISFAGVITFKNAKNLIPVVQAIPLSKMVVETDAPYLAPVPYRGQINYPKYISYTVKKIAHIKKINYEELVRITSYNANKLFGIK